MSSLLPVFRGDGIGSQLARGVTGSFFVQAIGLPLTLATGVLLARSMGPVGYGYYAYALAWLEFLKVPVAYGHPLLVQREVATNYAAGRWGVVRGLLRRANQTVFFMAVILAAGFYFLAGSGWTHAFGAGQQITTFQLALLMLPLIGLSAVRSAALNGLHRTTESLLAENIVRPLIAAAAIAIIWLGVRQPVGPSTAMIVQIGAVLITFGLGQLLLLRALPSKIRSADPVFRTREWLTEVWPFMLTGGAYAFWGTLGVIMLGWYRTPAEVGIYRVATVVASLTLMPVIACNVAISPMIARLHAEGNQARIQQIVSLSTCFVTAISVAILLVFVLIGDLLLRNVFGGDYVSGYGPMIALVTGNLCYAAIWTVMITLDMTGNQRFSLYALLISGALNFTLAPLLITHFGMTGAAIATTTSWFIGHIWLVPFVSSRVGIRPTLIFAIPYLLRMAKTRASF